MSTITDAPARRVITSAGKNRAAGAALRHLARQLAHRETARRDAAAAVRRSVG